MDATSRILRFIRFVLSRNIYSTALKSAARGRVYKIRRASTRAYSPESEFAPRRSLGFYYPPVGRFRESTFAFRCSFLENSTVGSSN